MDKRTNTVKEAFNVCNRDGKAYVQFSENGKEYVYIEANIKILNAKQESPPVAKQESPPVAKQEPSSVAKQEPSSVVRQQSSSHAEWEVFSTVAQETLFVPVLTATDSKQRAPFLVYSLNQPCYRCGKNTEILTYMLFDDGSNEDLIFPWDKRRLNKNKTLISEIAHMGNEEIEYYPIKIMGSDTRLDEIMLELFPSRIRMMYSNVQKRKYPMNVCQHCDAKQGEYYIYERLNKLIKNMKELDIFQY